jgi:hypothetical protein
MKKTFLALGMLLATGITASAGVVDFTVPSTVSLGDTFTLNVSAHDLFTANPTSTLIGFAFFLGYDATALQLVSGTADLTNWSDGPDDLVSNPALIQGLNFTGFTAGVGEPLALASLTFKALSSGTTSFTLTSDPSQFTGLVYDSGFDALDGATRVSIVAPEPGGLWLLAGGLIGLPLRRWMVSGRG